MDLLAELKARTRAHHDRIEAAINPMRPELTRDEYAEMLRRFYGFYAAWEDAAGPRFAGELRDFFGPRRKVPLLERDLRHLGATDAELAALVRCDELPPTGTFADALGAAYVLEGSTLGGQHIARHLGRTLGVTPDAGSTFFTATASRSARCGARRRRSSAPTGTAGRGR